jgi:hypothetical protein
MLRQGVQQVELQAGQLDWAVAQVDLAAGRGDGQLAHVAHRLCQAGRRGGRSGAAQHRADAGDQLAWENGLVR